MKRAFVGIMALVLFGMCVVSQALAADTGTIVVSVTINQVIGITVNQGTWAIGSLDESGTAETTGSHFTVENSSNVTTDLITTVGDSENWIFGIDPGSEIFAMDQSIDQGISWTEIDPGGTLLVTGLKGHQDQSFDLKFYAPEETIYGGEPQSFSITITAAQ